MWKAQLPANPNWLINEQMHKDYGLEKAVADMMSTTPKPTALLVMAYLNIIPMYTILNKLGYKIPQDISLIAFDDPTFASQISPALTVFSQPIEQFTQKAAQSLLNQIKKENGGEIGNDCSYLIERESVLDISKTNKNQGQTK
jgi:DNA-binding LacI/PurR family transcriptional regulator